VRILAAGGVQPVESMGSDVPIGDVVLFGKLVPAKSQRLEGMVLWVELAEEGQRPISDNGNVKGNDDVKDNGDVKDQGVNEKTHSDGYGSGSDVELKGVIAEGKEFEDSENTIDLKEDADSKADDREILNEKDAEERGSEGKMLLPIIKSRWMRSPDENGQEMFMACHPVGEIWEYCYLHRKLGRYKLRTYPSKKSTNPSYHLKCYHLQGTLR
jgi:hypothetical protein